MDFLKRYSDTIKTSNLALTTVLVTGILGMSGYLLNDFRTTAKNVNGSGNALVFTTDELPTGVDVISYHTDIYSANASLFTVIVLVGICLGIMLSKINNEYISSQYLETAFLFIVPLIAVVMAVLASVPFNDENTDTSDVDKTQSSYDITALILISIVVGVALHHFDVFKNNHVLGTTLFLALSIVVLGLLSYLYVLLVNENNKADYPDGTGTRNPGDHFGRQLSNNEENVLIATLSFSAIIVAGGIFHMVMERKYFRRMLGRTRSPRRSSPRRKISSLKP